MTTPHTVGWPGGLSVRVIGGAQFPTDRFYSDAFVELIQWMLTVDPMKRPTVHQVLSKVQKALGE